VATVLHARTRGIVRHTRAHAHTLFHSLTHTHTFRCYCPAEVEPCKAAADATVTSLRRCTVKAVCLCLAGAGNLKLFTVVIDVTVL